MKRQREAKEGNKKLLLMKYAGQDSAYGDLADELTMTEEVTIKELLEKAGVDADSERYQELASYIAAHGVYAVDLTGDTSEANTSETHWVPLPNQTQIVPFDANSEEEKRNDQNQNLPNFRFTRRCPGAIQRSQLRDDALSSHVDFHFEDGKWGAGLRSTGPRCLLHNM